MYATDANLLPLAYDASMACTHFDRLITNQCKNQCVYKANL